MLQFIVGLAVGLVLWGVKELVATLQRPRLQACVERGKILRARPYAVSRQHVETVWDVVLTVRNMGRRAAVDCVGWIEKFEVRRDGEWELDSSRPPAALLWEGTGDSQSATVRPTAEAAPRRLRVLSIVEHPDGSKQGVFAYADPDEHRIYPYTPPLHIRATVWVQPEGEEGRPASCRIEVEWSITEVEGGVSEQDIRVSSDSLCDKVPDGWWSLFSYGETP